MLFSEKCRHDKSAPRRSHTPEEIGQEQLAGRPTPKKNRASWQRGLRKVLSVRLFGARVQRGAGRLRRPQKATGLLKHRPSRQARPALCAGQGRQSCPVDVMPCVISYWVLSCAQRAADLQLRCTAFPLSRARRSLRDPQKGEMVAETDPTQWPRRKARHL